MNRGRVLDNSVTKQRPVLHQSKHTNVPPACYSPAHDPPKCKRFGEKIMRPFNNLERDRAQNRFPLLLIALYGIGMNFSAENASRKWPWGGVACGEWPMVTVAAMLLMLCAVAGPAAAARRPGAWSQGPWGDLFGELRPKARRAALPAPVPLPKPRPADAPATEPEKPGLRKQAPAETEKPAEQAAPPPSACRLALTEEIVIAPSIPDLHG